jgi:hypothetical protein
MFFKLFVGHVPGVVAIRGVARRLLGDNLDDRGRMDLLLHREDPGRVSLRRGQQRDNDARSRLVHGDRQGRVWGETWSPNRQHGTAHRTPHDLHPIHRTLRGPHGR